MATQSEGGIDTAATEVQTHYEASCSCLFFFQFFFPLVYIRLKLFTAVNAFQLISYMLAYSVCLLAFRLFADEKKYVFVLQVTVFCGVVIFVRVNKLVTMTFLPI